MFPSVAGLAGGLRQCMGSGQHPHILFRARGPGASKDAAGDFDTGRSRRGFAFHGSAPAFPAVRGGKLLAVGRHPKKPPAPWQVTKPGGTSLPGGAKASPEIIRRPQPLAEKGNAKRDTP